MKANAFSMAVTLTTILFLSSTMTPFVASDATVTETTTTTHNFLGLIGTITTMETQIFTEYPVTVTTTETQIEVESPDTTVAFDPTRAVDGYIKSPVHRCEVYKRSNRFLIAGRDWVPELLDNDGLGLRHQLYQCSSIQEWNFVYLSNSPDRYEWKAQGRLGSYPKRCIEKMGTEAGAPVPIKCNEYDIL